MKTKEEILDLTKMWFLHVYSPNYKVVDAYKIPEFTPAHWFILERIRAIIINSTGMYSASNRNHYEDKVTGLNYYWISSSLLLSHTMRFGIKSKQTISRIIADWRTVKPEILVTSIQGVGRGSKIFYAFTEFANTMLFNTGNVDVSGILGQQPESESEEQENTSGDPEVPAGTTKDPADEFPEWFDEKWGMLSKSDIFTSCNKTKGDKVNKYATDFAKGVNQLIDGTFYSGVGKVLKDKTIPIPEGLTVDTIIDSILQIPENKCITNPLTSLVLTTRTMCYSPLLKYWEKNSVAGSSTRSPATKPVTKSSGKSVRSNVQYTEEDYKSNRKVMYTYDYIKSYLPNGMVGEMVHGDVSDYWLDKNKFVKKYDNRITNFCLDMQEAYADAGKRRPSMSNVLDTLVDMAQFKAKEGSQKWEDLFWEYIDQMPVYQDNGLWKWFVTRYEDRYGEGQSNCDMYKGNTARKQAMERDAQLRACEASAFGEE